MITISTHRTHQQWLTKTRWHVLKRHLTLHPGNLKYLVVLFRTSHGDVKSTPRRSLRFSKSIWLIHSNPHHTLTRRPRRTARPRSGGSALRKIFSTPSCSRSKSLINSSDDTISKHRPMYSAHNRLKLWAHNVESILVTSFPWWMIMTLLGHLTLSVLLLFQCHIISVTVSRSLAFISSLLRTSLTWGVRDDAMIGVRCL